MKSNEWKFQVPPVSEEVIESVEKSFHLILPDDYKSFICEHSGSSPLANLIRLSNGREVVFDQLLHIDPKETNCVANVTNSLIKNGNQNLVPFGEDPFGNFYCFKYFQDSTTEIVYWDHENNSTVQICKTFTELVDSLYSPSD